MKNKLLNTLLLASAGLVTSGYAADGTIQFSGRITEVSCSLDVSSQNQTVNMGNVAINDLIQTSRAANKFSIKINDCASSANSVKVKFEGTSAAGAADDTFAFTNAGQSGAAAGVGFFISDAIGATDGIKVNGESQPYSLVTGSGSSNSLDFYVGSRKISDTIVPGQAQGSVQFTLLYP